MEYRQPPLLPSSDQSFDIVYSKGVMVHIHDWLSPTKNQWGNPLQKMCEIENLTLYAETETHYHDLLEKSGFSNIQMRDENKNYLQYNEDIVNRLKTSTIKQSFSAEFGEAAWQEALEGYQLIADSIRDNELLIRWFKASRTIVNTPPKGG